MTQRWVLLTILAVALTLPAVAYAHGGHTHKVVGTVTAIDGNHLTVKTTDGKSAMVMLDAKTKITQGKATLAASAIKVGTRIVAAGAENKGMVTAATIQVGTAPAAATTAAR
jgi:hypothetical protein